jgi:O-antigen/teichoic acid export membrane protein
MTDKSADGSGVRRTDSSLSKKVSKGALWVTAATICAGGLNVVSAIILARLLAPEEFGLMAIVMAIVAFSQGATQTGFGSALIQKQDRPEDFLNTAWTFELIRYLILFLIIFLAAPFFASFFNEPRSVTILRVISLTLVFQGLRNIGVVYFRKNLDFKNQFVFEVAPMFANICVVIPLAFSLRNVWALVWASLATNVATCCISYIMHPYRPRIYFNIKRAVNLFNFGKWILGESIIGMIREQGMTMFVGKFLGIPILGLFNRAGVFSTMILQQIIAIVWKVGYPAYSQLQYHPERFKQVYLKTLQLLTFVGIPMAGGLFVLSYDFVHLFLTDKWLPIVPLMQILCLQAMFNIINTPAEIAFQATGRPAIGTKISTLGVIILAISLYPLTSRWGATGAVASLFLSALITSPIVWYMAIKVIRCSSWEFLKPILISLINTGIMVSTIFVIREYYSTNINYFGFFGLIFIGIIVYLVIAYYFDKYTAYGMYRSIRERMDALTN